MPTQHQQNTGDESLKKKSNRLFKYQQNHKSELPAPPTPTQCRQERVVKSQNFRKAKVSGVHDNNRNLFSCGFTKSSHPSHNDPPTNKDNLQPDMQTELINKEITESISSINETREKFSVEINNLLKIADNKDKTHEALSKIIVLIQSSNEKILKLQESTQHNLLKLLAMHKDQELANMRRDITIASNSNRIQSIETKSACNDDLHKIWITFTCDKELEQLKSCENLIYEAKNILKRMDINIDKFGILPIRSAYFQNIKVESNFVLTLCVAFTNEKIASIVRRQIMMFNVKLEEENRISEMRYNEKIFWSKNVWKVLKICWELKRVALVDFVNVRVDGISVQYKVPGNSEAQSAPSHRMIVTNFSDIDRLRKVINDIHIDSSCTTIYDDDYFKLRFSERDQRRSGEMFYETNGMEVNES